MNPARIARRMIEKHGRAEAIRRAVERLDRTIEVRHGVRHIVRPARWLLWSTVANRCAAHSVVSRREVLDAIRSIA